jgi:hypothetical protein
MSEAEHFRSIAVRSGVEPSRILVEAQATNTGENIEFSRNALEGHGVSVRTAVLVTKPYMQRRALATAGVRWPGVRIFTSAPSLSFEQYQRSSDIDYTDFLNLMVGDLQRMRVYAELGFQTPEVVPDEVWSAYEKLVAAGYDRYILGR